LELELEVRPTVRGTVGLTVPATVPELLHHITGLNCAHREGQRAVRRRASGAARWRSRRFRTLDPGTQEDARAAEDDAV